MRTWLTAVIIGALSLTGCEHFPLIWDVATGQFVNPEIKFRKLESVDVAFDKATFHFLFDVTNPNRSGIFLAGYDAAFAVEGHTFLNSTNTDEIALPAQTTRGLTVPVTVVFDELRHTLKKLVEKDEVDYALNGGVRFRGAVVENLRIPLGVQGRFPVPRPPSVSLKQLKIKHASLTKGITMTLGMELGNPNGFDMLLNDIGTTFSIGGTQVARLGLDPQSLRKKSSSPVTTQLEVSSFGLVKTLITVLADKQVDYALDGTMSIGLWEFKPWTHRFSTAGKIEPSRDR